MVVEEGIPCQHYYYLTYKQEPYLHVVLESPKLINEPSPSELVGLVAASTSPLSKKTL